MTTHSTITRAPRLARLMAVGASLAAGLLVAPQLGAQAQQPEQPKQELQKQKGARQRGEQQRARRMDPARMERMQERRVAFLTERLQLTADQQTRTRQALAEERKEMAALRTTQGATRDRAVRPDSATRAAHRAEMLKLRERADQRIESILTEQQRTAYRALREERRERGVRGRDGGKRGPRGQHGAAGAQQRGG